MEANKRYYFTDPLKAAWMSREFGVTLMVKAPYTREWDTVDEIDLELINDVRYFVFFQNDWFDKWEHCFLNGERQYQLVDERMYIHPASLSIFEPMEGDVGESEDGQLVKFRNGEWVQVDGHDLAQYHPPVGKISIIRRNRKSFEAPEEQA